MIKIITAFILTILLAYTAYLYSAIIPWWGFAIGSLLVGIIIPQKPWVSWLCGFAGLFFCWAALAWYTDSQNQSLFSSKMAQLLPLKGSSILLIIITALLGAIVGGFAALTGSFLRKKQAQPA